MNYILPNGALNSVKTLRQRYETKKGINLDNPPAIGMPISLGGVDCEKKDQHLSFVERVHAVLEPQLLSQEMIKTPKEFEVNLAASRADLAAKLYIMKQSSRSSTLKNLMKEDLGMTAGNAMSDEDKEICYLAANRLFNNPNALDEANAVLAKAKLPPFSEREWKDFCEYLHEHSKKAPAQNAYSNFPVTNLSKHLFGATFAYAGAAVGTISGQLFSQSTQALSIKFKLSAFLGGILIMGPMSPSGVFLFAPVIAEKLISSYCSISFGHLLGIVMGLLGQGVGVGVGVPIDVSINILTKACSVLSSYLSQSDDIALNGLRIIDGKTIVNGVAIELTAGDNIPKDLVLQTIEIQPDGNILVDGKTSDPKALGLSLPPGFIDELINHIQKSKGSPFLTDHVQAPISSEEIAAAVATVSTM